MICPAASHDTGRATGERDGETQTGAGSYVGRRIHMPVGYYTAFSGDLSADIVESSEPRTDRLWLNDFDRVAASDEPSILTQHKKGVAVSDAQFVAEDVAPPEHSFAEITPELLRSLNNEAEHYVESA